MDWGNFKVTKKTVGDNGAILLEGQFLPEDKDFRSPKKLHWLPAHEPSSLARLILVEYDTLITAKSIPKDADFKDFVNPVSKQTTEAFGDPNLKALKVGDQLQFERLGYFVLDKIDDTGIYFVQTPDGHSVNKFLAKKVTERKT